MGSCGSKTDICNGGTSDDGDSPRHLETDSKPYLPTFPKYTIEDTTKPLKIRMAVRKRPHDNLPTSYSFPGATKGTCLIINNSAEGSRKGADVDVKNMQQLFKELKFTTKIVNSLKAKEVLKSVEAFAKNCKTDICFVVIIGNVKCTSARNELAEVGGIDEQFVPTADVIDYFSEDKCPQMKGRPKVFLFHGHYYDETTLQHDYSMNLAFKDIFIANAILTGKMQKQSIASYYIQAVCQVFMHNAYEKDLESMIQRVEEDVYNHDRSTQHTNYDNLFFKKCYLYAT